MTSAHAHQRSTAALVSPCLPGPARWLTGERRCILLPPVPVSTRPSRDFTTAVLRDWRLGELIQDAVLIASELTANAVRHGAPGPGGPDGDGSGGAEPGPGEPVELAWLQQPGEIICMVTDANSRPPLLAAPDLGAESGRGLQIVDALAANWGWAMRGPCRKAVWAALRLPGTG